MCSGGRVSRACARRKRQAACLGCAAECNAPYTARVQREQRSALRSTQSKIARGEVLKMPDKMKSKLTLVGGHIPREAAASGAMSIAEYQTARQKLRETYGDSREGAGDRWEQELALLFARSRWTERQLADQERHTPGMSKSNVNRLLIFGRFLLFNKLPPDRGAMTEHEFRGYWRETVKGDDDTRFREVIRLMEEEPKEPQSDKPKAIGEKLMEQFADGKWYPIEDITAAVNEPMNKIRSTLETMIRRGSFNSECASKPVGKTHHFRIVHQTRKVSADELRTKLGPILKGLIAEGKKNMTTMSPGTVAHLAHQLKTFLDEWTK